MIPLRDVNPSRKVPVMTILIILANVLVFIFQISLPRETSELFLHIFGFTPLRLTEGLRHGLLSEIVWSGVTLFTSMFLHGSFMHLLSNMWALWLFGDNVEDRLGHLKFLLFYFLSGIVAMTAHYVFNFTSDIVAVGASGAIAGVMGAYFVLFPFAKIVTLFFLIFVPIFIDVPAFIYIGLWFISQLSNGIFTLFGPVFGSGIAWWAHIGGFLFGMLVGPRYRRRKRTIYFDGYFIV